VCNITGITGVPALVVNLVFLCSILHRVYIHVQYVCTLVEVLLHRYCTGNFIHCGVHQVQCMYPQCTVYLVYMFGIISWLFQVFMPVQSSKIEVLFFYFFSYLYLRPRELEVSDFLCGRTKFIKVIKSWILQPQTWVLNQ
jgi:hypothetical protein